MQNGKLKCKILLLCCNVVQIYRFFMFSRWQKWNYCTNNLQELKVWMLQVGICFMRALFAFVP